MYLDIFIITLTMNIASCIDCDVAASYIYYSSFFSVATWAFYSGMHPSYNTYEL